MSCFEVVPQLSYLYLIKTVCFLSLFFVPFSKITLFIYIMRVKTSAKKIEVYALCGLPPFLAIIELQGQLGNPAK